MGVSTWKPDDYSVVVSHVLRNAGYHIPPEVCSARVTSLLLLLLLLHTAPNQSINQSTVYLDLTECIDAGPHPVRTTKYHHHHHQGVQELPPIPPTVIRPGLGACNWCDRCP